MSFKLDNYVEVKDRVPEFWDRYPNGRIICEHPHPVEIGDRLFIASHALVFTDRDDEQPAATGSAWEQFPGTTNYTKNSEAMNAETSAVGRALGFLGIGIGGSLATADEVRNRRAEQEPISDEQRQALEKDIATLTDEQKAWVRAEWKRIPIRKLEELTVGDMDAVNALISAAVRDLPADADTEPVDA